MTVAELKAEARRLEEDLLWTEKAHFQSATVWRWVHWLIGIPSSIAATIAGLSAVKQSSPSVTIFFAIAAAVLSTLLTFLNPLKTARESHNAGVRCNALRGKVRRYYQIDLSDTTDLKKARENLEKLADLKAHLIETTPHIGGLPYWLARLSIERGQHAYEADDVYTG